MVHEAFDLFVDAGVLLVGADDILGLAPEGLDKVELGRAGGQPQQRHVLGGLPRGARGVAGVLVQEQGDVPATVGGAHQRQERLEVGGAAFRPHQKQARAGAQVQGAKDHALGVAARKQHRRRLAPRRPARP